MYQAHLHFLLMVICYPVNMKLMTLNIFQKFSREKKWLLNKEIEIKEERNMLKGYKQNFCNINLKEKGRKSSLCPELCALCHYFLPGPFLYKKGGLKAKITDK